MRILHLIPCLSGGGAERQLSYLAPEMARAGHEVHIAYLNEGREAPEYPGVVLFRLASHGNHDPVLFLRIYALARKLNPQIIQTWIPMMDILGGFVSSLTHIAWICREPTSVEAHGSNSLKIRVRKSLVKGKAAAVIANSNGGRLFWLKQGVADQRTFVVHNAISTDHFAAIPPAEIRNLNQKFILYAGRLAPSKNVDILIKVMSKVRQFNDAILLIAGEGPLERQLKKISEDLKIQDSVFFLGYLQSRDLWSYMKAADVLVSLSSREGNPNCVLEAAACHLPLVVSDIPSHREFLDERSAILVATNSEEDIVRGLLSALNDRPEALERAARALETIAVRSPAEESARYLEIYKQITA